MDFGSQSERSTLPPCEGIPYFALSLLPFTLEREAIRIYRRTDGHGHTCTCRCVPEVKLLKRAQ